MEKEEINKYRNSDVRADNDKLLEYYQKHGQRWSKCLCNMTNRKNFNKTFFNWYDKQ